MTDRILAAAERHVGTPYGTPRSRSDLTVVNCSTLTARILDAVVPGGLSTAAWNDIEIAEDGVGASGPWSPIDRAVADGWAEPLPDGAAGLVWTGWYLVQGWASLDPLRHGHAMLAWFGFLANREREDVHADGLRVLHATYAPANVTWRGLDHPAPRPLSLADAPRLSVADLAAHYPAGLRFARLKLA